MNSPKNCLSRYTGQKLTLKSAAHPSNIHPTMGMKLVEEKSQIYYWSYDLFITEWIQGMGLSVADGPSTIRGLVLATENENKMIKTTGRLNLEWEVLLERGLAPDTWCLYVEDRPVTDPADQLPLLPPFGGAIKRKVASSEALQGALDMKRLRISEEPTTPSRPRLTWTPKKTFPLKSMAAYRDMGRKQGEHRQGSPTTPSSLSSTTIHTDQTSTSGPTDSRQPTTPPAARVNTNADKGPNPDNASDDNPILTRDTRMKPVEESAPQPPVPEQNPMTEESCITHAPPASTDQHVDEAAATPPEVQDLQLSRTSDSTDIVIVDSRPSVRIAQPVAGAILPGAPCSYTPPEIRLGPSVPRVQDLSFDDNGLEEFDSSGDGDLLATEACRFYMVDPAQVKTDLQAAGCSVPCISLNENSGWTRSLFLAQVTAVWWMLNKERGKFGGGFIADPMGMGKTMITILHWFTNAWLTRLHRKVDAARERGDHQRHLPLEGQSASSQCPSQDQYPIVCPCVENGPSARLRPLHGAFLHFVPPGLIPNVVQEVRRCINQKTARLYLFVQHAAYKEHLIPQYDQRSIDRISMTLNGRPVPDSERFLVVTSEKSYSTHVKGVWATNSNAQRRGQVFWGCVSRDEFHKVKSLNHNQLLWIKELNKGAAKGSWPPRMWFYSGTPWKQPRDLEYWVDLFTKFNGVREEWRHDSALAQLLPTIEKRRNGRLVQVSQRFDQLQDLYLAWFNRRRSSQGLAKNALMTKFVVPWRQVLAPIMLRRTERTQYLGEKLTNFPKIDIQNVYLVADERYAGEITDNQRLIRERLRERLNSRLATWEEAGSKGDRPDVTLEEVKSFGRTARVMANFPYLNTKVSVENQGAFTWEWMDEHGWCGIDMRKNPLFRMMKHLEESSIKLRVLKKLITEQMLPTEKLLIMADVPATAKIIEVYLRNFLNLPAVHFDLKMSAVERDLYNTGFQEREFEDDQRLEDRHRNVRIVIGTATILGEGGNWDKAYRTVMFEPFTDATLDDQASCRTRRVSQIANTVTVYRFVGVNEIEMMLLERLMELQEVQYLGNILDEGYLNVLMDKLLRRDAGEPVATENDDGEVRQ